MHAFLAAQEHAGGLSGFAVTLVNHLAEAFGGPGAGLANMVDSVVPFIPSEVILPLAGVSAGQGHMSLVAAVVWTTVGSVAGALVLYLVGMVLGRERTRAVLSRVPLLKAEEIDRSEAWFARHGGKAVFFGRMLPVFRALISVPAGIERMPVTRFVLYTAGGSLVWNTVLVYAGYKLGQHWEVAERYASAFTTAVGVLVLLAVLWFVVTRLVRRRRAAGPEGGEAGPGDADPASAGAAGEGSRQH
ncbi:DedA family protein [Streptomyces sp. NPDC059740]|uniref:DedA family protein n=1 Tax=Streptomyces sp. NPDC059740 TaxID=3346926 RepID=UPI0036661ABA